MLIYCFTSNELLLNPLQEKYPNFQWQILANPTAFFNLALDDATMLLFSPFQVEDTLISPEASWKKYLAKKAPQSKLIVAGFVEATHSNYLDLLQLPPDLSTFIEGALSARAEWKPIHTGSENVDKRLKHFLEGHGTESTLEVVYQLRRKIQLVREAMDFRQESFKQAFQKLIIPEEIYEHWQTLTHRWQRYYLLFSCLPFFELFEEVHILIEDLSPDFQAEQIQNWNLELHTRVFQGILRIDKLLREAKRHG